MPRACLKSGLNNRYAPYCIISWPQLNCQNMSFLDTEGSGIAVSILIHMYNNYKLLHMQL